MMALLLSALILALSLLSVLLYQSIRDDKIEARLNDLSIQAAEIAYLASQRTSLSLQMERYLYRKVEDVQRDFGAAILVLDRLGRTIQVGLEDGSIQGLTIDEANEYLRQVVDTGEPIRIRVPAHVGVGAAFTVVVPWKQSDIVMGAVFIHTSAQTIQASYRPVLLRMALSMALAAALAGALLIAVTRGITRPVRRMSRAAERIARGEFDTQIPEGRKDEIGALARAFNEMARGLSKVEEMRRAFVSDVSHELRSPLTSMQGFLQGMLDGTIPPEDLDKYINIVLDETRRMNRLVGSLLELSRIESGKTPLAIARFELNEFIRMAIIRQEARIDEKKLDVDVEFRQDPCYVSADSVRVDQVLTNLIDNAIKYVQPGGTLTIWTHVVNDLAHITISDNGPGIPEEELPYIFDRFHTVDKARTSGMGTGLGLAIVKKIIELHNQSIRVTSTVGKGTCFMFTLPYTP
jgi:signal transduction histidine kinase